MVMRFSSLIRFQHLINQERASLAIEWQGILIVPLAQHVLSLHSRHLFHGPIPCNNSPFTVNGESRIREKIDDIRQTPLRLPEGLFHLLSLRHVDCIAEESRLAVVLNGRYYLEYRSDRPLLASLLLNHRSVVRMDDDI